MTLSSTARKALSSLSSLLADDAESRTIDADTHITDTANLPDFLSRPVDTSPNYYHGRPISAEQLLMEMDMSGVDMALVWQNPAATPYVGDGDANFENLMKANRYIFDTAARYPDRFIPAGWTDPEALGLENALKAVEICIKEYGFPVVKMNPAQNAYPIDSDNVMAITERIAGCGAVTAFHYGADTPYTPASGLEKVAKTFPDAKILAVHMGGGGAGYLEAEDLYLDTREMGIRNPNIHFAVSAKRDTHAESDFLVFQQAGEPYCRNISCGSDAPYGRVSWNFGGYRAMFATLQDRENHPDPRIRSGEVVFTDEAVKGYLGRNFAELIKQACSGMLVK